MKKLLLVIFLLGIFFALYGGEKRIPAPRGLKEIKQMMRITWNQHILPQPSDSVLLEKLLECGEVILFFDSPKEIPWMSSAGILINAPVELVWEVVTDSEHMHKFVPMTERAQAKKLFDGLYQVNLTVYIKMSFLRYRLSYGLYDYRQPPYRIDWSLCWGEFDKNVGFWELIPTPDGRRTMAFYSVYSEPRSRFLKAIYSHEPVLEMMTNLSTATMIVRAIKKEAERRFFQKSAPIASNKKPSQSIDKILNSAPESLERFLKRGNLLVLEDGPTVYVIAGALVKKDIQTSYNLISDFSRYPDFVSGVRKVELVKKNANQAIYRWDFDLNLGFVHYRFQRTWEYKFYPPEKIIWEIERKQAPKAKAFWKLIPSGKEKTLIFYGSTADLRQLGFIVRYALKVEPTLEYAILACQSMATINSVKKELNK